MKGIVFTNANHLPKRDSKDSTYASYTRSILSRTGSCRSEKVSFGPCRSEKVAVRPFLLVVAFNGTQLFQNDMVQN